MFTALFFNDATGVTDDETLATTPGSNCTQAASNHYFAFQVRSSATRSWSNMQFEYR